MKKKFKHIICILILFQNIYADESLYKDYVTSKNKRLDERIGMEFAYDYMQTNGIDAKERFGFNEDITSIGTSMSLSYLFWKPNDTFDLSANINWSYQEPYYMSIFYYGLNGKYHFNRNHALRFMYTYATQKEIGDDKRGIELGTGTLWSVGYEYKLNNIYRFFFDYKKASLEGMNLISDDSWVEEYTNYDIDIFSVGLGANFTLRKKDTNHLKNDGSIEDMSISLGFIEDSTRLKIKDSTDTLTYPKRNKFSIPITIKSKPNFLNKSETVGYRLFSFGFDLFDYKQKASHYYLYTIPEDVAGHYIYLAPSIFYTNDFMFQGINHTWKIEASSGVGFLTLDAKNLNSLDVENKLGTYSSLSAEVGLELFNTKDVMIFKYSSIKQKFNNHNIRYNIYGNTLGLYINFKFKDIFSKDW
jgi:hypothetical protein